MSHIITIFFGLGLVNPDQLLESGDQLFKSVIKVYIPVTKIFIGTYYNLFIFNRRSLKSPQIRKNQSRKPDLNH